MKYTDNFLPNLRYHIFNHAVGDENLFRKSDNYFYFLQKYIHYIQPIAQTYAYCLMPNHFHFLIQIRTEEELKQYFQVLYPKKEVLINDYHQFLMQRFSNLFNAYAKAYNKMYERKGALFLDYLRRSLIDDEQYFTNIIAYIHSNPIHHKFCKNPDEWAYSSYQSYLSDKKTNLPREEVLDWFGGIDKYKDFHFQNFSLKNEYEFVL